MTDCNAGPIVFSSLGRRSVVADFGGGDITGDGGALLLREVDRHLGLVERLDAALPDPRDPSRVLHQQRHMLAQRVFAIALGHEDCNDHHDLRLDPLIQAVTGRGVDPKRPLASPATLGRLGNRVEGKCKARGPCGLDEAVGRKALFDMASVLVEVFISSHEGKEPPGELVLDFDATDDTIHGNQVGRFFHGYYDDYCFLPLYVFCGDHLLVAYLRPSDIDAAKHSRAILKLLVDRLRRAWPGVKITIRADSGFCRWRLMRWCDRHGVYYVLGLAKNKVLEKLSEGPMLRGRLGFEETGEKRRLFDEFAYAAGTWDRPRRTILRHEHDAHGPNPRYVVTNVPPGEAEAKALYEGVYCARGECENRIKEQQLDLFAGRTSCHEFLPNQFRVLLSAAAYVLLDHLRRRGLAGTQLEQAQAGTIRLKLLKVGARVVHSARRVVLQLGSGYPLRELFTSLARKLIALPALPILPILPIPRRGTASILTPAALTG
jgi:hypothetical protein